MISAKNQGRVKDAIKFRSYYSAINAGSAIDSISGDYSPINVSTKEEGLYQVYTDLLKDISRIRERIVYTKDFGGETKKLKEQLHSKMIEYAKFMMSRNVSGRSYRHIIKQLENDVLSNKYANALKNRRKGKHEPKLDSNRMMAFHDEINYHSIDSRIVKKIREQSRALENYKKTLESSKRIADSQKKLDEKIDSLAQARKYIIDNIGIDSYKDDKKHLKEDIGERD